MPEERVRPPWGWHRLRPEFARALVDDARVVPGDLVLDIGAGTGTITQALLDAGARVVAVELHPQRVEVLRARFPDAPVVVVRADAADLRLPRRPFRVVANPPFALTSVLLRRLLAPESRLETAALVLARTAATRWEGSTAPGAARRTPVFELSVTRRFPRSAFVPRPRVDIAVLHVERRIQPGARRKRC